MKLIIFHYKIFAHKRVASSVLPEFDIGREKQILNQDDKHVSKN